MKLRIVLAATLVAALSCNDAITGLESASNPATETFAASLGVNIAAMSRTSEGVYYSDLVVGTGPRDTTTTDSVFATYTGRLKDGKTFDTGTNVKFVVVPGAPGGVIAGVRIGLLGAKEGGKRKLVIPSELGYGANSRKNLNTFQITIPRQSTLIFDIELLKVYNHPDSAKTSALVGRP